MSFLKDRIHELKDGDPEEINNLFHLDEYDEFLSAIGEDFVVDPELHDLIPPLTQEEYEGLERSIIEEGCREPLIVWGKTIVDGHNRYEICKKRGIPFKTEQKEFEDRNDVIIWMIRNQFGRRNLTPYQRSILALRLKPAIAAKAKENQAVYYGNQHSGLSQNSVEVHKAIDTQKELAKAAGVSHDTISRVEKIEAKATPEVKKKLEDGSMSINEAYKTVKKQEKREQRQEKITEQISQPKTSKHVDIYTTEDKYRVIYADPPWSYGDKQNIDGLGGAEKHYPTMSLEDICKLPVPAEDNAVLFIWVTSPMLEDCFKVINAWGFKYKSSFVWDKVKHNMGHYNSVRHEFLLVCTRGSCTPDVQKLYDSVVSVERTEHSRKPKEFRDIIDTLYPAGNRLELFAREAPEGWDVWGNMA